VNNLDAYLPKGKEFFEKVNALEKKYVEAAQK